MGGQADRLVDRRLGPDYFGLRCGAVREKSARTFQPAVRQRSHSMSISKILVGTELESKRGVGKTELSTVARRLTDTNK